MNRRANAIKPFLFYNEDYYRDDKPKQYFRRRTKILFSNYKRFATNRTQCKKLITHFLDYCMPKYYRHHNNIESVYRLLNPLLIQQQQQYNKITFINQHEIRLYKFRPHETEDNMVLYEWLTRCTGTENVADNLMWIMREFMKRVSRCNLYFYDYYKLFQYCLSTLFCFDECKFMVCIRLVLSKCMSLKSKGVITSKYKYNLLTAMHYFIVNNLRLFMNNIVVLVKLRRLLIKHHMYVTNARIYELCKSFAGEHDVKLHQKLLLKHMMHYQHIENMMWPSLANIKSVVKWDEQRKTTANLPFNTSNIKYGNKLFKYTGWDEEQRFCRTVNFKLLKRLHINKDGSKELKCVVSKKRRNQMEDDVYM